MPEALVGDEAAKEERTGKMTRQRAMEIAEAKGAFDPTFYGEVVIRIKAGGVTAVEVKQTFV